MHGCAEPEPQPTGWPASTIRAVPELRSIIAAIGENFDAPLTTIREAIRMPTGPESSSTPVTPHLATAMAMCDDVARLTRRYLDFIDQVEALPRPRPGVERPDEVLAEIDRRIMPEAFGRGVAWSCASEGPIRAIWTDRTLCLEALLEWASLAVESARPGDCISLVSAIDPEDGDRIRLTLASSANELVTELTNLREDPLFNRLVCVEEVGIDAGSRLALSIERLGLIGAVVDFGTPTDGLISAAHFRFPAASATPRP